MNLRPSLINWDWDTIDRIGKTKTLRSSYFFFLIVPIIANVFIQLPQTITIPWAEAKIPLTLELPFKWMLFFWCAVSASVGNVIYSLFCPELVRRFTSFEEFKISGRSGSYLVKMLNELLPREQKRATLADKIHFLATRFFGEFDYKRHYFRAPVAHDGLQEELEAEKHVSSDTFYYVRDAAIIAKPAARLAASVAYILAFALLFIVLTQNLMSVIRYVFV